MTEKRTFSPAVKSLVTAAPRARKSLRELDSAEWPWWAALLLFTALIWCAAYNRWTAEAWLTPVHYSGDSWAEMATAKALASGDVLPVLPKYPKSLGAPFVANWNDYPSGEEGIFLWYAAFVRLFGVFVGSNLTLLTAHILAAASFFFVCLRLNYAKAVSFALAILFGMSGFAFARSLWHLVLTFYWHVPLGLLVAWWCLNGKANSTRKDRLFCIAVCILHGLQYMYYTGILCQFLLLASLVAFVRHESRSKILFPLALIGVMFTTFVLMNIDTLSFRLSNGPNSAALVRLYAGLEIYALRPVELFIPALHRIEALQEWANRVYYSQSLFQRGESNSVYIGVVAVAGLIWIAWLTVRAIAAHKPEEVPNHAWGIGWILSFSIIGGLNGIVGLFGLVLFRGTNRYSIVILAIAFLFLAGQLTRKTRHWPSWLLSGFAAILLLGGLADQIARTPSNADIQSIRKAVATDATLVARLESKLAPRAMVLQLPIAEFPEVPPIEQMQDYEHMRPYLHSRSLRYAYGSHKGRTRERWQHELMNFGAGEAIAQLEKYGFSAVLINRKGYLDQATWLQTEFRNAGRSEVLAESDEFVSIALRPSAEPLMPPEFDQSWYELEGNAADNWRWSMGNARLILYCAAAPRTVRLRFTLESIAPAYLEIFRGLHKLYDAALDSGGATAPIELTVALQPGRNELSFRTNRPGELPGNGDTRKLTFRIRNFTIE